jgi:Dihaem cytochrome c
MSLPPFNSQLPRCPCRSILLSVNYRANPATCENRICDTRSAQRFKFTSPNEPLSITATPAWQGFHRHLDPAVFSSPSIRARSNCVACHSDADSGRFDPQAISLPP